MATQHARDGTTLNQSGTDLLPDQESEQGINVGQGRNSMTRIPDQQSTQTYGDGNAGTNNAGSGTTWDNASSQNNSS